MQTAQFQRPRRITIGSRAEGGFSLIEIIAAFLIFAVGFGVLLEILTSGLRMAHRSEEYTQAALWAQTRMASVGVGEALEEGVENGEFDDGYRWQLEVAEYQPPESDPALDEQLPIDLYRVALTVSWGEPGREKSRQFVTLRAVNSRENQQRGMALSSSPDPRGQR